MRLSAFAFVAGIAFLPAAGAAPSGVELFARADLGACAACHQLAPGAGPPSRADLGPRLGGARMRSLGKPAIRAVIVDPTVANPDTVMPPYGRHRILDAAEIDRLVDYLYALP